MKFLELEIVKTNKRFFSAPLRLSVSAVKARRQARKAAAHKESPK